MNKKVEIADVFRKFYPAFRERHSALPSHQRAARDIVNCMTPAMGGGRYRCADCGESFWSYHGCRNRSCPKCHGRQTADWLKKRQAELFPCAYFHVVATAPSELRELFRRHQKIFYSLLMQSAARALCELASDRHYIGAEPGILAVLHTWDTELRFHPHVHMLVSGGGADDGRWCEVQSPGYLVPVKKLSSMISRRFSETLRRKHPDLHAQIPAEIWKREWCSFCKPFGTGQDAVLNYLARYVFRIAVSNARILSMDESNVRLRCKNNRTGKWSERTVSGVEFIRRFLQHVLPRGFHKVRYYGLWSPRRRKQQLLVRLLFLQKSPAASMPDSRAEISDIADEALRRNEPELHCHRVKCPKCNSDNVECLRELRRGEIITQT